MNPTPPQVKESYFGVCERIPAGQENAGACLPSGQLDSSDSKNTVSFDPNIRNKEIDHFKKRNPDAKPELMKLSDSQLEKYKEKIEFYRSQGSTDWERIESLLKADKLPPVLLGGTPDDWWVKDGYHRLAAMVLSGQRDFLAYFDNGQASSVKSLPFYYAKTLKDHEYGCLMAVLPDGELRKAITEFVLEIPEFHLGPNGSELRPHITVKYGFEDSDPETVQQLRSMLTRIGPIEVELGELSLFKGVDGQDVLKIDVSSPILHQLHEAVSSEFRNADKYPDYQPHLTLAYLNPEISEFYLKNNPFQGKKITFTSLEWSGSDGRKETIPVSFTQMFNHRKIKTLSFLNETSGGALVEPPEQKKPKMRTICINGTKDYPTPPQIEEKDHQIEEWKKDGVPSIQGFEEGDAIVEKEVLIPYGDPRFWMAVEETQERMELQNV